MSKPYGSPSPGDKLTYDGEDFYAIRRLTPQECGPCAFRTKEAIPTRCGKSPCPGVAWVPLNIYITHRLTS